MIDYTIQLENGTVKDETGRLSNDERCVILVMTGAERK